MREMSLVERTIRETAFHEDEQFNELMRQLEVDKKEYFPCEVKFYDIVEAKVLKRTFKASSVNNAKLYIDVVFKKQHPYTNGMTLKMKLKEGTVTVRL